MENLGVKYLEAIYRKHGEDIKDEVIQSVLNNVTKGVVMRSEYQSSFFKAVLYCLDDKEKKRVSELEAKYEVKICHVLLRHTREFGKEYIYIMAPKSMDDLEYNVKNGWYTAIVSNDFCTEIGDVGIEPAMGGFYRIW